MEIVKALEEIRMAEHLNDAQFAARLGIHRDLWSKTKLGKVAVGWSICTGVLREFGDKYPALKDQVTAYMASVEPRKPSLASA